MESREIYKAVLGMIDLTSLNATDTPSKIAAMTEKVNAFHTRFPDYPLPASICVYPNFARTVASVRADAGVHVTVVGGCFPASQSTLPVKIAECEAAVRDGADEVDIVLALNAFLEKDYAAASREITEIGAAIRRLNPAVVLKVILETGWQWKRAPTSSRLPPAKCSLPRRPRPHASCAAASAPITSGPAGWWASSPPAASPRPKTP